MTYDQLDKLGIDHKWLAPLEETFAKYDISTPVRQACFIGQCAHESGNFKTLQEKLTGKENYANCGTALGIDLVGNPTLLIEPKYAALSAGWFWRKRGLNDLADASDIETMTKRINGGLIGLEDRKAKIAKTLSILG